MLIFAITFSIFAPVVQAQQPRYPVPHHAPSRGQAPGGESWGEPPRVLKAILITGAVAIAAVLAGPVGGSYVLCMALNASLPFVFLASLGLSSGNLLTFKKPQQPQVIYVQVPPGHNPHGPHASAIPPQSMTASLLGVQHGAAR